VRERLKGGKMEKKNLRLIVAAAVILVLYHLVIFALPFVKCAMFFVSYVFTLIAFGLCGLAIYHAFKKPDVKSKFYGFPVARIGVLYLAAQLVVSLVFMAVAPWVWWWLPVLCYAGLLVVGLLGLVSTELTTEEILRQDAKLKKDVSVMRSLQSKILQLAAQCEEPLLKQLADEMRFSDPVSDGDVDDAEADLSAIVDQLQQAVSDEDGASVEVLSRQAIALLAERNRLCKLSKA
jgi:hypothetical protein